jgi:hypothetical protein
MAISIRSNRIRKFQAGRSAFLVGALLLTSCRGGAPIDWSQIPQPDPGWVYEDAYIPYVEEVVFPEPIYAGEEFYVGLELSAALHPEILLDGRHGFLFGAMRMPPKLNHTWQLVPWVFGPGPEPPHPDQEAKEHVERRVPALPAGEWVIGVESAVSREWGGFRDRFHITPGMGAAPGPEWETRLYTITVVERPAGE